MVAFIRRLGTDEEGATMVEYALMLALIGVALITALTSLRSSMGSKFTSVSTTLGGS